MKEKNPFNVSKEKNWPGYKLSACQYRFTSDICCLTKSITKAIKFISLVLVWLDAVRSDYKTSLDLKVSAPLRRADSPGAAVPLFRTSSFRPLRPKSHSTSLSRSHYFTSLWFSSWRKTTESKISKTGLAQTMAGYRISIARSGDALGTG